MNESVYLQIAAQRKIHELDNLLEKKQQIKALNLTLLRFDQLSTFLNNRSSQEIVKLQKQMSPDMRFFCDVAMIHKDIGEYVHTIMGAMYKQNASIRNFCLNMMFDGNAKTIKMFEKLDADDALKLYHQSKPIREFGKSIEKLMAASQEERKMVLDLSHPTVSCYPYPIITHCYKEKVDALNHDLRTDYLIGKKVLLCCDCDKVENDWTHIGGFLLVFAPMMAGVLVGGGTGMFIPMSNLCCGICNGWHSPDVLCLAVEVGGGVAGFGELISMILAVCKSTAEITL